MYKPKYTITNNILKNIGVIEACREVIVNAPLIPAYEARFQEEAIARSVHFGTHLEGNPLDFYQVKKIIEGGESFGEKRDVQEVINYRSVLKFIEEKGKKIKNYSEKILLLIHKLTVDRILKEEEAGRYRKRKVVIKDARSGEIAFSPPPPEKVKSLVRDFFNWLNSKKAREIHPVIRSGITHYELVRIHPFLDGNGRTARAMATLVLFREGYDIRRLFSLEEYFDKNYQEYYQALKRASETGDLTSWLEFFTQALKSELLQVKEKVLRLSRDLKFKGRIGGQVALSERQLKMVEYLQEYGEITIAEAKKIIPMVSGDTLLRDMRDLIKKGVVKKKGTTKGARYLLR